MVRSIPYLAFKGKCRGEFFGIIHTMKANTATATTVALSVAVLTTLSACARTFDFSAGKWNRAEFFEARNDDWDRGAPIVQMPDCLMNANDPSWSDEELFKHHQIDVFSSLVLTNRFRGDVTFSSRMSFDHRMAPALVIAGECAKDSQGRTAFRDMYEIVLYDEGLNVWRHRRPSGGKSEIEKVAYAAHGYKKRTQYELQVVVKRRRVHGGRLTTDVEVSSDGVSVGFRDETVPEEFYVGLIGSEGRCRFYDFKVDDAAFERCSSVPSEGLSFGLPFKNGAVLQRGRPIPVWGRAKPGEKVRVTYGGASAAATADESGAWRANLPSLPASAVPRPLSAATASSSVVVDDVVVGEVWLCSGQSNMAQALVDPKRPRYRDGIGAMVAQATCKPFVRYLETPVSSAGWCRLTPEFLASARRSAIAVHYALELHEKLGVPVGVVVAAVGGCNIDSFLPSLKHPTNLDARQFTGVYPYSLRGAVWYQGETNIYLGETDEYAGKLRQLYDRWRDMFANPGLRFYYVQLAPFARGKVKHKKDDGTEWTFDYDAAFPKFLCVQAEFEKSEPNAAMTVINDLGCIGDIHPNEKWLVAKRIALHALKRDYGFDGVEDCSPEPTCATAVSNVVKVSFGHAKSLYAYQRGQRFSPDLPFELAGADGAWRHARVLNFGPKNWDASGVINGDFIELAADGVDAPAKVRYAWNRPWTGVVYNDVDLPLATFEMDVTRGCADAKGR